MKINDKTKTIENTNAITTTLTGIDRFSNVKNGNEFKIIVLKTNNGNFSNYESVWNKQLIDVESLDENDKVKITYTTYTAKNGIEFNNFVKVEML